MFTKTRTENPFWFYFAVGLLGTVIAGIGIEAGYFAVVAEFLAATYHTISGWVVAVVHAITHAL